MRALIVGIALTVAVTAATTAPASVAPATESTRQQSLHAWTLLNEHGPGPHIRESGSPPGQTPVPSSAAGPAGVSPHQHVFPGGHIVRDEIGVGCPTADGAAVTP